MQALELAVHAELAGLAGKSGGGGSQVRKGGGTWGTRAACSVFVTESDGEPQKRSQGPFSREVSEKSVNECSLELILG